jgi:pyruvate dehydrogenase E2 component (dihydrolipoamide acetyltransferase)
MQEFRLPDLGEGMQEAEIRRWLIKPGDTVKLDQPMVEVETDKAVVEIPAPLGGRVAELHVQEGQVAKLGEVLVSFVSSSNNAPSQSSKASSSNPVAAVAQAFPVNTQKAENGSVATLRRVLAAPAVRRRAFELGIDLEQIPSTQPNGRITMDDLLLYAEKSKRSTQPAPATASLSETYKEIPESKAHQDTKPEVVVAPTTEVAAEQRQALTGLRRRIAEHMERSWRSIPHATAFGELDGSELIALRRILKPIAEQRGTRLTYVPLLIKLLIPVLKEFPVFNASFDEEKREIVYKSNYHIGIATDTNEGLLVPVLRNADRLTIVQIAQQLEHLVEAAQKRTLAIQEVSGSTFTLNNIGSFGGSVGTPIINYPEAAILAVGRLQEKAVVRNGSIQPCTVMPLALSFDHRLIDGALAGKFLARFQELVEHPQQIILDMV